MGRLQVTGAQHRCVAVLSTLAGLVVAISACGATDYTLEQVDSQTELDVQDQGDLPSVADSMSIDGLETSCGGLVILGDGNVSVYESAGDTLAMNPTGTVAVKTDSGCVEELEAELEKLP